MQAYCIFLSYAMHSPDELFYSSPGMSVTLPCKRPTSHHIGYARTPTRYMALGIANQCLIRFDFFALLVITKIISISFHSRVINIRFHHSEPRQSIACYDTCLLIFLGSITCYGKLHVEKLLSKRKKLSGAST
jgi:hypothetical protein